MASFTPFFAVVKRPYQDVPITDKGVDTAAFLEATEDLTKLFGSEYFGSAAFGVVKSDMEGNIRKVRERFLATPDKSATLEELVTNEKLDSPKKRPATEGLMWLLRGLDFTAQGLRKNFDNKGEELSVSFTDAYGQTLKKYHSFVIKPVFTLAMKATPYRKDFYPKLAADPAEVDTKLPAWLDALQHIVSKMQSFYASGGFDKGL